MTLEEENVSSLGRKVYLYLKTKTEEGAETVVYSRQQFSNDLGLKPQQINEALVELRRKNIVLKKEKKGGCSYQLLQPMEGTTETMPTSDTTMASSGIFEDSSVGKLFDYIQAHQPIEYRIQLLSKQVGLSKAKTKSSIRSLLAAKLVQSQSVSGKGNCLIAPEVSLMENAKPNEETLPEKILYLVDTENAASEKVYQGIEQLRKQDCVVLIMSQNSRGFSNAKLLHRLLSVCSAKIETCYTEVTGKNALDFVLVSEAAMRLTKNPRQGLCVISNDQGFDVALTHLAQSLNLPSTHVLRKARF